MALPTISYVEISRIPFRTRQTLTNTPLADLLEKTLTPGQVASLFPSYVNQVFTANPNDNKNIDRAGIPPAYQPASSTNARTVTGGTSSEREKLKKELVPGGLVPGPDGKPMRVPDLAVDTHAKDIGNGKDLHVTQRMAIVQKSIEDQLKAEGYNAKDIKAVAAAFTGQVSRESDFDPTAEHDRNAAGIPTGYGIYGARNDRMNSMFEWLADNGYAKDSLVGQARFMAHEAVNKFPKLMDTLSQMDGKDIGNMASMVMDDFEQPDKRAAGQGERISAAAEAYGLDLTQVAAEGEQTATPLKTAYDLSPEELKVAVGDSATALAPVNVDGPLKPIDDPLAFLMERNPNGADLKDVDPKLLKSTAEGIQQYERLHPEHKVQLFGDDSGFRRSGSLANHGPQQEDGLGGAMDTVIINRETGEQLRNHARIHYPGQTGTVGEATPSYLELHSMIQLANDFYNPKESDLRTGVGFSPGSGTNAGDLMHIDQRTRGGMAGFSWATGLTPEQMRFLGTNENFVLGDKKKRMETASQLFAVNDQGEYINAPVAVATTQEGTKTIAAAPIAKQQPVVASVPQSSVVPEVPAQPLPKPTANNASLAGTVMGWGYNAAAGGAEITDPSYIVSADGKKLTKVAETGPERVEMKVTPRNRAEQFGPVEQLPMPSQSAGYGDDQKMTRSDPMIMGTPQPAGTPQQAMMPAIDAGHQKLGVTQRLAYAGVKFSSAFNTMDLPGDTGMPYISRGIG